MSDVDALLGRIDRDLDAARERLFAWRQGGGGGQISGEDHHGQRFRRGVGGAARTPKAPARRDGQDTQPACKIVRWIISRDNVSA